MFTWGKFILTHIVNSPDPRVRYSKRQVDNLVNLYLESLPAGERPVMLTRDERLELSAQPLLLDAPAPSPLN